MAAKISLTPNQVTIASFIASMGSIAMFSTGNYLLGIISLLPFHLGKILDCADGQLAAIRNMRSKRGAFLDPFFDRIVDVATLAGLSAIYLINFQSHIAFYLTLGLTFVWFIASYLDKQAGDGNSALENLRSLTSGTTGPLKRLIKWDGGFSGLIVTIALVFPITIPFVVGLFLLVATIPLPLQFSSLYKSLKE